MSDASFRALGAEVVPELNSGTYSRAFDNGDLEKLLSDYSGPREEVDPWLVELTFPQGAEWTQYQFRNTLRLQGKRESKEKFVWL